jgi:hypothetical protein
MTIAERAALAEREKLEGLRKQQHAVATQASSGTWVGLDSLVNSSLPAAFDSSGLSTNSDSLLGGDDWGFGSAPPSKPTPPAVHSEKVPASPVDWGLDDLSAPPRPTPNPSASTKPKSIWDLDDITPQPPSSPKLMSSPGRANSPGGFDSGHREDADSDNEGDILGVLGKPIDSIPKRPSSSVRHSISFPPAPDLLASDTQNQSHRASSNRNNINGPVPRPISPPPHILGKIVEMGFSIQQARIALASTDTGLDVETALDTLLLNGASSSPRPSPPPSVQTASPQQSPEYDSRQPHSAARLMGSQIRDKDRCASTPTPPQDGERNIQEQADRLLAQASEIGLSVLSKASLFWKEGKGRVQKAYEERAVAAGSSSGGTKDGRPKWMQETTARCVADDDDGDDRWRDQARDRGAESGFSDEVLPGGPTRAASKPMRPVAGAQPQASRVPTVDLFSADEPVAAYVSPFRRSKPTSQQTPQLPPRSHTRAPSPIRPVPRTGLISASNSVIARSSQHKTAGTAKFKLGQYADAESAYTAGIGCLPTGHLLLVPLYNNRALARLRTGDHAGAAEDAGMVVEIVGEGYRPAREEVVKGEEYVGGEGGGVDLGEALAKALRRRAEAWEGREKWAEAGRDWETLAGKDWVKPAVKTEAVRGAGRCRRMVVQIQDAGRSMEGSGSDPKPKAKPKPRPTPTVSTGPSQALENLRNVTDAAEREDQVRHELKDMVDSKLGAWKGGKESNIRALLGSLDLVLWPELGLRKVGMADLVSEKQVKVQYTRTIARLHPDKVGCCFALSEEGSLIRSFCS